MFEKKVIIVGFLSAVIIFLAAFFSGLYLVSDPMLKEMITFSVTAGAVAQIYPSPFLAGEVFEEAEQSLLSLLDPFSYRLSRNEYRFMMEESTGKYGGVGITIAGRDTALMVVSVREGSPAYKAGVISGDLIVSVDGKKVPSADPLKAVDGIRGPSGTEVSLTIMRPAIDDTIVVNLTRENIKLEHLPYYGLTQRNVAYIRIADFEAGSAEDLKKAVKELQEELPAGYILDLKSNPGGYLNEAIAAADLFLGENELIVGVDARSRWDSREFYSRSLPLTDIPVVILTDRGSASAAEIFTGALRGADRAVVIGDTTFGKGLVQSLFPLNGGQAVRLTTSRYSFAGGRYLNPPDSQLNFSGLAPDIVFSDEGEATFRNQILSGFLIYDFVEDYRELLWGYPDQFNYPDTLVGLFADFARGREHDYRSLTTETLNLTGISLQLESVSDDVLDHIRKMTELSRKTDSAAYFRHAELIKFTIRRLVVERKSGRQAVYRDVIVPGRADIRMAEELILDPSRYQSYLKRLAERADSRSVPN